MLRHRKIGRSWQPCHQGCCSVINLVWRSNVASRQLERASDILQVFLIILLSTLRPLVGHFSDSHSRAARSRQVDLQPDGCTARTERAPSLARRGPQREADCTRISSGMPSIEALVQSLPIRHCEAKRDTRCRWSRKNRIFDFFDIFARELQENAIQYFRSAWNSESIVAKLLRFCRYFASSTRLDSAKHR